MNIYSLLDDSDNEEERKVAPTQKNSANNAKKAATNSKTTKGADVKAKDNKSKGPADNKAKSATVVADAETVPAKDDNRGGRGRGHESTRRGDRHGARGGGSGWGNEGGNDSRRPKREFDRRSGTGRGREVSKGGRGAFGAGSPAQDALEAEKDPKKADELSGEAADKTDGEDNLATEEADAEPEAQTFTMDEYLARREESRKASATLGGVRTERTVDKEADFAGLKTIENDGDMTFIPARSTKAEVVKKDQRSTGKNQVLNVGFKFGVSPNAEREGNDRRGGGRGGRGGQKGNRGGNRRGDRNGGSTDDRTQPNSDKSAGPTTVFDSASFPSL